ncbi:MAG TPA: hypothetical protein VNU97_01585 [Rhizomicrobium sp.]|jgi:hypothetical protein|nr:hypothetical protein [Rhizomicrobium sp.]
MTKKKLLEDIVHDPSRFHRAPFDVVRDRRFNDEERLEILTAWEREIREQDGENETQRLQLVCDAKDEVARRVRPAGQQGA